MRSVFSVLPLVAIVASATVASAQKPASGEMVKLIFPNSDVRDVLAQYELLVGKHLIFDNNVQGNVNINVPEVPRDEAIKIIELTLMMNGYHIIPVDGDPSLLKVIGLNRAPRQVSIPLIADPEPIPENEQVIMYLVKLQYADPTELAQVLGTAMPASRAEYSPSIVALPKAQSLLITENTAIIRTLQRIIRATDVEPTKVEGEFITLQRASAKDVVTMLEKMFEKPNTGGATPSAPRPVTPVAPAPNGAPTATAAPAAPSTTTVEIGGMTEDSMIAGKVRLTADERTNRIYVVSRPANLPLIRNIIKEFDQDVHFNEPVIRELKYVSSGDILDALVKAISDPGTKDAATGTTGATGNQRPTGATTPAINNNSIGSPFGAGSSTSRSSTSLGSNMNLATEPRMITPTTVLVGNSRVVADNRRNAIIVIGSADVKEKVFKLLDQLDVRAPQVMLSTVIGELTLSDSEQFGITYLLHNGDKSALTVPVATNGMVNIDSTTGTPTLNLQNLLQSSTYTKALVAGQSGIGGFVSIGSSLDALVTALESTQRFRVTSRPSLFTSNNKKATISSGEEIAVATSVQSGLSGTTTGSLVSNSSVQFKPIELSLEVIPLINSDREVYLDIVQKSQEQTGETKVDTNTYPKISTRALQTSVMVPNEGTLVLGGLIKHTRNKTVSGIPILSKAPLIGPLFRSTSVSNKRTELVILIRPSVSLGPTEDMGVRDRNMKAMRIPVNIEDTLGERSKETISDPIQFRSAADAMRDEAAVKKVEPEAKKADKKSDQKPDKKSDQKPAKVVPAER